MKKNILFVVVGFMFFAYVLSYFIFRNEKTFIHSGSAIGKNGIKYFYHHNINLNASMPSGLDKLEMLYKPLILSEIKIWYVLKPVENIR